VIPIRLYISDWASFQGTHLFEFPSEPGLYFLWGRNEAEPRLGSNGAGKSRVWEALCWVFFGRTSEGLKAGDISNWEVGKKASVTFEYLYDGVMYQLKRQWSPNLWTLRFDDQTIDLAKEKSNPALEHLGLNQQAFLATILISQDEPMFLDLKAEAKASLFSEIMDLDRWITYSKRAASQADELEVRLRTIDRAIAGLEGSLSTMRKQDSIPERIKAWEAQVKRSREALDQQYDEKLDLIERLKTRLFSINEQVDARAEELRKAKESQKRLKKDWDLNQEALEDLNEERVGWEVRAEHFIAQLDAIGKSEGICPTCGQPMSQKHLNEKIDKAEAEIDTIRADLTKNTRLRDEARKNRDYLAVELDKIEDKIRSLDRRLSEAYADQRATQVDMTRVNQDLDRIEDEVHALREAEHPFKEDERKRDRVINELVSDLERLGRDREEIEGELLTTHYWVRWCKEIRLELIEEALQQLEVEVNSEMSAMGLVGWEMRFAIDRETASGSIQRGFSVTVSSPKTSRPVPWEAWSGGEAQRLRNAAQCGLANLIRSQTGCSLSLEAWDEPTGGLSPQGINDLMSALQERAVSEGRQVWVIDHHALNSGYFKGSAGVIKDRTGSKFDLSGLYI